MGKEIEDRGRPIRFNIKSEVDMGKLRKDPTKHDPHTSFTGVSSHSRDDVPGGKSRRQPYSPYPPSSNPRPMQGVLSPD